MKKKLGEHRLWDNLIIDGIIYTIKFANQELAHRYYQCFKKVGRGEGAEWVIRAGKSEEQLIKDLRKAEGVEITERPVGLAKVGS